MNRFNKNDHPHRRWNPLTEEWILVSPHRAKRPWSGSIEKVPPQSLPEYDPHCYLCPGNLRAGGVQNPTYESTFVFDNDFAALLPDSPLEQMSKHCNGLVREQPEVGVCRVVCFSPRHDLTLAEMSIPEILRVITVWQEQYQEFGTHPHINSVTIFENRGEMMGCSNPHPHGQIWSNYSIPVIQAKELYTQKKYFQEHQSLMLLDYLNWELEQGERVVLQNDHFVVLVPHWAVWPFEVLLLPRRAMQSILELTPSEKTAWAEILKQLLVRYDNLFEVSFPYSMGIHQQPVDGGEYSGLLWHQHFYPPLLRSATIKKFQVGYEMAAELQRDITPEQAAERLRNLSAVHFKNK
ncbi:MAG: UDP-glucose--hexose-1-phosphate uridylyltransferase [bacterium]